MPGIGCTALRQFTFMMLVIAAACAAHAGEPVLEVTTGTQTRHLDRSELLKNPAMETIDIPADVAYQRPMRYRAVPLSALVPSLRHVEALQFTALDGFVANISGTVFAGNAQPWLAIESADAPWPALKSGGSAGPFYLVWLKPEAGHVSQEQWPYQIAKITEVVPLEKRYPQIMPRAEADKAAQRGMQVFAANCASCHKLNGGGDAAVGPDLNKPFSPTEYFNEPFLRKLIRDSASVRNWGNRIMPAFSPNALSDAQLDDLLAYLRQMAVQR